MFYHVSLMDQYYRNCRICYSSLILLKATPFHKSREAELTGCRKSFWYSWLPTVWGGKASGTVVVLHTPWPTRLLCPNNSYKGSRCLGRHYGSESTRAASHCPYLVIYCAALSAHRLVPHCMKLNCYKTQWPAYTLVLIKTRTTTPSNFTDWWLLNVLCISTFTSTEVPHKVCALRGRQCNVSTRLRSQAPSNEL